jgi:hypothetical protein
MSAKQVQHMIEKRDGGRDFLFAGSIQVQYDLDFRFLCLPDDLGVSRHNFFLEIRWTPWPYKKLSRRIFLPLAPLLANGMRKRLEFVFVRKPLLFQVLQNII